MKIKNSNIIPQGSPIWFEQRLGKITSSEIKKLRVTPQKAEKEAGLPSKTSQSYLMEVVSEIFTNEPRVIDSKALAWGSEWEDEAVKAVERAFCVKVERVGFYDYEGPIQELVDWFGGSPDGLIPSLDAVLEIKCPFNPVNHAKRLVDTIEFIKDYQDQVKGNMILTGASIGYLVSYDPRFPETHRLVIEVITMDTEERKELEEILVRSVNFIQKSLDQISENIKDRQKDVNMIRDGVLSSIVKLD